MLAAKRVLECDRIPSQQRNDQPLKQELCLMWFLWNPCYSSTPLRDKLQCQRVPCSTRLVITIVITIIIIIIIIVFIIIIIIYLFLFFNSPTSMKHVGLKISYNMVCRLRWSALGKN